jgi:hypothetical protein
MATKYKADNNVEFKTIDRDIRKHEWNDDDFDLSFTDSTSPFDVIIAEIEEPGMEYYFALNSPERLDRLMTKGWRVVSPDRLANKRNFTAERKGLDAKDCITTGDTILLERPMRFGDKERAHFNEKSTTVMKDTLTKMRTDIYNPANPFSGR